MLVRLRKMRMRRGEAAVFAVMVGFTSCMVMLAGISVRGDAENGSAPEAASTATAAPGTRAAAPRAPAANPVISARTLEVLVRDASGHPVRDAQVSLAQGAGSPSMARVTDAEGTCEFRGLTRMQQEVCIVHDGYGTVRRAVSLAASSSSAADHLEIVMRRGNQTLAGRVLDPDSNPVAQAVVEARAFDVENGVAVSFDARTTTAGTFEWSGVPDLPFEIKVTQAPNAWQLEQPITARPADGSVVLHLGRGAARDGGDRKESLVAISGVVLDKNGKALGDVEVRFTSTGSTARTKVGRIVTDRKGAFAAQIPSGSYRVTAHKTEFASAIRNLEIGQPTKLEPIVMSRGGEIAATLTDASGRPIVSVPVRVIGSDPTLNLVFRTADDGSIHATELPEGTYLVKAAMPAGPSQEVEVHDGQRTTVVLK